MESSNPNQNLKRKRDINEYTNPIDHWIQQGNWSEEYLKPDNITQQSSSEYLSSTTQIINDGERSPVYSLKYEETLAKVGIFMHPQYLGQASISYISEKLCDILLDGHFETPNDDVFGVSGLWIERMRTWDKALLKYHVTHILIPSAEHLWMGGDSTLEPLIEEVDSEWTKCVCLAGPRPIPFFAVGFKPSAFTKSGIEKLDCYTAPQKPTFFTRRMCFPFLVCEVGGSEVDLNRVDRKNAHSASLAVDAIVQLYRDQAVSRVMELHLQMLVFSISHDFTSVRIYGHYASIEDDKTTFHRYLIRSFDFIEQDGKERWAAYQFTRKVYATFAPIQLERLRSAIAQLPDPPFESFDSTVDSETNSHETARSLSSLQQENDQQQEDVDRLEKQIEYLKRVLKKD